MFNVQNKEKIKEMNGKVEYTVIYKSPYENII